MKTFLALVLLASPALAQDLITEGLVRTVAHDVQVEIHDRIAATSVTQVFENLDGREREGTYIFSVPPGASIVEFQMWIGDRIMKGEMLDRKKAEEVYRSIVDRKKDPGIVDHVRDNVWRVRVYPIMPSGQMKFLTRYVEVLPCLAGQVSYTLPFSLPEDKVRKMDQFSIQVDIHAAAPVTTIDPAGMSVVKKNATRFIAKGDRSNVAFQKDIVVKYESRSEGHDVTLMAHRSGGNDGYFLMSVSPDLTKAAADRVAREVVYVLDASSSIDEKLFKRLCVSIADGLRELGPKDRFNILAFNSDVVRFQDSAVEPSAATFKAAAAFLQKLKPQGRTDLRKALQAAAAGKGALPRVVFVVSDGSASAGCLDPGAIVKEAGEAFNSDTVLYAVQVGLTTERTLEALARRTGGECVAADETGVEQMFRAVQKRFARPIFTSAKIDFGGADVYDVTAPRFQYADEPILVSGRYRAPGAHPVEVTGRIGEREVRFSRTLEFPEKHDGWASASYVWAGRRIAELLDEEFLTGESDAIRATVATLSREHRIMTPYTAFLVLETEEMYGQFGLERTAAAERKMFAEPRRKPRLREGNGVSGLPDLSVVKVVDPLAASAESSLLESLRWLAANMGKLTPFKEGGVTLTQTGVTALALQALVLSNAYDLNPQDRTRFEEAAKSAMEFLRKSQSREGRIGETIFDHVFAAEALGRLLLWHPQKLGAREMLQKAVCWLSDQPELLEKRGTAALAAPAIMVAKDLRLEVDLATIKFLERSVDGATDPIFVRAQMALDPYLARNDRVCAAARRIAEKGPADMVSAYLGSSALFAWRGENSIEWRAWQQKMDLFRRTTGGGVAWIPRNQKEEARAACTAFRALALEESYAEIQKR